MFGFLAQLLSWCYGVWPNYAAMILLFTLIIMLVVTPFTIKGMRSAAEMARIQPEMKKLQDQYKNDRIKQNEEMQALFKEHGVNPLGGCLPTLLPLPIFFIIFRLLERMNARKSGALAPIVRLVRGQIGGSAGYVEPHYLSYKATLTQAIIHSNGQLKAFGFDLALAARNHHPSVGSAIPYWVLIAVMTASQYWQQHQINQRNPAAANANPQMKMTMQLFPAFYAIISINIPAAVVFYLLVSGLFRMAQNTLSYKFDPVLARAAASIGTDTTIEATSRTKGAATTKAALSGPKQAAGQKGTARDRTPAKPADAPQSFMGRLRQQAADAKAAADQQRAGGAKSTPAGTGTNGSNGARKKPGDPSSPAKAAGTGKSAGTAKSAGTKASGTARSAGTGKAPATGKAAGAAKSPETTRSAGTAKGATPAKATPPAGKPRAVAVPVPESVDGPDDAIEVDELAGLEDGVIEASVVESPAIDDEVGVEGSGDEDAGGFEEPAELVDTVDGDDSSDGDTDEAEEVAEAEPAARTSAGSGGASRSPLSVRPSGRAAPRGVKRPKDR